MKLIREMRTEIQRLKSIIASGNVVRLCAPSSDSVKEF